MAIRSYTILVVEDDQPILELLAQVLHDAGYNVLAAKDARQALKLSRDHQGPIHVLMADIVLPDQQNGLALARQLLEQRPELKMVYMSGYQFGDDPLFADTLKPGRRFLPKPFTVTTVLDKIGGLLD